MTPIQMEPQYVAATSELNELNAALFKVTTRLAEIDAALVATKGADQPTAYRSDPHVAAALQFAATGVVREPDAAPSTLLEERDVLDRQRGALQATVKARRSALEVAVQTLSIAATEQLRDKHRKLVVRYVAALELLDALVIEEEQLCSDIESQGYEARFGFTLAWPTLGSLREMSDSTIWHRVQEARAYLP